MTANSLKLTFLYSANCRAVLNTCAIAQPAGSLGLCDDYAPLTKA